MVMEVGATLFFAVDDVLSEESKWWIEGKFLSDSCMIFYVSIHPLQSVRLVRMIILRGCARYGIFFLVK